MTEHTPARQAIEGTVIPAGQTLGILPDHAADSDARDAAAVLIAAGHTPAPLSGEVDDDDADTARGTGFMIHVKPGGRVLVHHLVDGVDSRLSLPDDDRRAILRTYRQTLRDAGWQADGQIFRAVHAWRTSPLPQGVTAAQTRGEEPVKVRFGLSDDTRAKLLEQGQSAREVFRAEMDEREAKEARAHGVPVRPDVLARIVARRLPTMDGHRFEVKQERGRTVVRLYADGQVAPVFEDWTYHEVDSDAVTVIAREMVRVRTNHRKETAALLALDDATVYQLANSEGLMLEMTGAEARAHLASYREECGPEGLNSRNTPKVTLSHSGAHWLLTVHAYKNGHRDLRNTLRVSVEPLVTAKATQVIRQATGGGTYVPMETLSVEAFGPWVRPVADFPGHVMVHWVTCGTPVRPGAERHADVMATYGNVLKGAGWAFRGFTEDGGMVFQEPEPTA